MENRVNAIRKLIAPNLWKFCSTGENPAGIVTRISKQNVIDKTLWWEGPQCLNSFIENEILTEGYVINKGDSLAEDFIPKLIIVKKLI